MPRFPVAFAFLVLAWVCANQLQFGVAPLIDWIRSAGELSHQESMLGDLREKLAAAERGAHSTPQMERSADGNSIPLPGPLIESSGMSRIELAMESEAGLIPPDDQWEIPPTRGQRPGVYLAEPASPVPRSWS